MSCLLVPFVVAIVLAGSCRAAQAAPEVLGGELRSHGEVSRRLWVPSLGEGARHGPVSAGLALGLKGPVRQQMGRSLAPAVTLRLNADAQLSLVAAPGKGAMVLLQTRAW